MRHWVMSMRVKAYMQRNFKITLPIAKKRSLSLKSDLYR